MKLTQGKAVFLLVILAFLLAGIGGVWWLRATQNQVSIEPNNVVPLVSVRRGSITQTINYSGVVEPLNRRSLRSETGGVVSQVYVHDGQSVRAGDVLLKLDNPALEGELEKIRLSIQALRTQLGIASERFRIMKEARSMQSVSELDFLEAQSHLAELRSRLAVAESDETFLSRRVDLLTVRAPFDGIVASVDADVGDVVAGINSPVSSNILAVIDEAGAFKVNLLVTGIDVSRISRGMHAEVFFSQRPFDAYDGEVMMVSTVSKPSAVGHRLFPVEVHLRSVPEFIRIGMTANVRIFPTRIDNVLTIPISSVFYNGDIPFVFLKSEKSSSDSGFVIREVTLGEYDNENIVVIDGLSEGDVIALSRP